MPAATDTLERISTGGHGPGGAHGGWGGDGPGGGRRDPDDSYQRRARTSRLGIWVALAPISMFFAAFCSAYIVRRGLGGDWQPVWLPAILWVNTALLLGSSVVMERGRSLLRAGRDAGFRLCWNAATLLGVLFLLGQMLAWRQLAGAGIYVAGNPSASFLYVLTAAHAVHLLGGEMALGYVGVRAGRHAFTPHRHTAVDVAAIYWHFMGGLWLFLFVMLQLWR